MKPAGDSSSLIDTQPIPPLPPRPSGNVPVLDFSETGVLALESARVERPAAHEPRVDSEAYRLAAPPVADQRVDEPFVDDELDDPDPAWIVEPSGVPVVTVDVVSIELDSDDTPAEPGGTIGVDEQGAREPDESVPDAGIGTPAVLRVAAAIVTDRTGRCLLVRTAGRVEFTHPGGALEPGESALDALSRELRDELGLELDESAAEYLGVFRAPAVHDPRTLVSAAVFALVTDADVAARGRIDQLLWIDRLDGIPVELAPLARDELLPLWASRRAGTTLF
ncbi:MAG TPA: NUDIX domain-containing protein [Pseudolysinimonas sp.]|nr:NUDIX domain-containing protein [Pseudolysinimonas sp.]